MPSQWVLRIFEGSVEGVDSVRRKRRTASVKIVDCSQIDSGEYSSSPTKKNSFFVVTLSRRSKHADRQMLAGVTMNYLLSHCCHAYNPYVFS